MAEGQYSKELLDKIDSIPVYQGGLEEVSRVLGADLEIVDTGQPEKFIISYGSISSLKSIAYHLKADLIVHYFSIGPDLPKRVYSSHIGTPARYKYLVNKLKIA